MEIDDNHSIAVHRLDAAGNVLETDFSIENLFDVVQRGRIIFVDGNVGWRDAALKNPDISFVLSRAIIDEDMYVKNLFTTKFLSKYNNLYVLLPEPIDDGGVIALHKMDIHCKPFFDALGLDILSSEHARATDPRYLALHQERRNQVNAMRDMIWLLLGVSSFEELGQKEPVENRRALLSNGIKQYLETGCKKWFHFGKIVACCYARALIDDTLDVNKLRTEREKFLDDEEDNKFNDTMILHNALFLGGEIYSGDGVLTMMASYVGVRCTGNTWNLRS